MNRRKIAYIAGFIALAWILAAAFVGILMTLGHLFKNTATTILVFEAIVCSGLVGFAAAQLYNARHERERWLSERQSDRDRGWGSGDDRGGGDDEEIDPGWRREKRSGDI